MRPSTIAAIAFANIAAAAPQGASLLLNPFGGRHTTSTTRSVAAPTTTSSSRPIVVSTTTSVVVPTSASTSASSSVALPTPTDYASTALYGHNIHRANHSAPALTYNNQLAGYAATVAASCVFAHDLSEGGGGYGQNIAAYGSSDFTGFTTSLMLEVAISDQWYDSEVNYFLPSYYGQPTPDMSNFEAWGHFSQIVWYSSTGVGCATQLCAANTIFDGFQSYFTVCNYEGAGNIGGLYGVNVLEPLGEATYAP